MTKRQIARNYRRQGYTYDSIAKLMNISRTWAYALCNDHYRQKLDDRRARWIGTGTCPTCGGPMTSPKQAVYLRGAPYNECEKCYRRRVSEEAFARHVQGESLLCRCCHAFKPFDAYPKGGLTRYLERRSKKPPRCTACDSAARADYRRRHATPCVECGTPRNGASRRIQDSGLCRSCWLGGSVRRAA